MAPSGHLDPAHNPGPPGLHTPTLGGPPGTQLHHPNPLPVTRQPLGPVSSGPVGELAFHSATGAMGPPLSGAGEAPEPALDVSTMPTAGRAGSRAGSRVPAEPGARAHAPVTAERRQQRHMQSPRGQGSQLTSLGVRGPTRTQPEQLQAGNPRDWGAEPPHDPFPVGSPHGPVLPRPAAAQPCSALAVGNMSGSWARRPSAGRAPHRLGRRRTYGGEGRGSPHPTPPPHPARLRPGCWRWV